MIYDVYKANRSEWWAGSVEANDEQDALIKARNRFPSKNATDTFRVQVRSAERQADIDLHEAKKWLRAGTAPMTYYDKCRERVAAHRNDCIDRKIRALPSTQGCERTIERIAENMEKAKV